ncbi:MAG: hypothetical protein M3247_06220, partial [Thermoproteota archaeon]|nr:hypothetical protein [Thermoproteota archaeon]
NHTDHVKRARLEENCNKKLDELTKGRPSEMGGSLDSILNSQRYEHLLHVTRVQNKKNTLIYPHIPAIQEEVKRRKIKNLNDVGDRLVHVRKGESAYLIKSLGTSVSASDRLSAIVTKKR